MKSCDRRRNGLWLLFAWFHSCYDAPTRVSYLQQLFDSFLSLGNLFRILVDTIYLRVSWSFGLVIDWWLDREKKIAPKVSSCESHKSVFCFCLSTTNEKDCKSTWAKFLLNWLTDCINATTTYTACCIWLTIVVIRILKDFSSLYTQHGKIDFLPTITKEF